MTPRCGCFRPQLQRVLRRSLTVIAATIAAARERRNTRTPTVVTRRSLSRGAVQMGSSLSDSKGGVRLLPKNLHADGHAIEPTRIRRRLDGAPRFRPRPGDHPQRRSNQRRSPSLEPSDRVARLELSRESGGEILAGLPNRFAGIEDGEANLEPLATRGIQMSSQAMPASTSSSMLSSLSRPGWLTFAAVVMFSVAVLRVISAVYYFADSHRVNDLSLGAFGHHLFLWASGISGSPCSPSRPAGRSCKAACSGACSATSGREW